MDKTYICTACPKGCPIRVIATEENDQGFILEGHSCQKGKDFVLAEMINPVRILTTTVQLNHHNPSRLPVRSDIGIPKKMLMACMSELKQITVDPPVSMGETVVENILGLGINIIASRSVE